MTKGIGFGTSIASSTGGTIAQIRGITGPGTDFNDVDTTTLDASDNYRTFVPGIGDAGELSLDLAYGPDAVTHKHLVTLMNARTEKSYTITHGTTAFGTQVFSAYVKGISQEIPLDDLVTSTVTLKVTGSPGYASTT